MTTDTAHFFSSLPFSCVQSVNITLMIAIALRALEGCQRIHREAGEVCDIFITDCWEKGIKCLVPNKDLFWYFTVCDSPGPGRERHASARHTVLSCRHSREVTRRDSPWLTGIKATQLYLTDPPPAISFTKTGTSDILDSCFFFLFFLFLHGPLMASGPLCSCSSCTTDTYATVA